MSDLIVNNYQSQEKKSLRDGFGKAILDLAKKYKDVVALSADLISSTRLSDFQKQFPDRFFQIGVAEQNMVGIAAGLAIANKIPFATSFATFCPGRCLDQIRVQVCLNNLNVKLIGSHAGLSHQTDGPTAQATEDIAIMRSLPRMKVIYPADYNQMIQVVEAVYHQSGPVYLRMTREPTQVFINSKVAFQFGKGQILKPGEEITLISAGPLLAQVLKAAKMAENQGISCEVINLHTIKPIDQEIIIKSVKKTNCLLTIEDHQVNGGLGSAVSEIIVQNHPVISKILGLNNQFSKTARNYKELLKEYQLTAPDIFKEIKKVILKKKSARKK